LLVQAATTGAILGPAVGMLGFAISLALPFTLFAMFPSWLKTLPKSGGWLNSIKVVLGFLELALSLKFLSNVDLAYHWEWFDREIFLVLWIILFALLGFYLLGKIRFAHDTPLETIGVPRFFLAVISLSFSLYMLPGLWGAPLKAISAFYHHNKHKILICIHVRWGNLVFLPIPISTEKSFTPHSVWMHSLIMMKEWLMPKSRKTSAYRFYRACLCQLS
jgi:thiol:disulfide interchange protein